MMSAPMACDFAQIDFHTVPREEAPLRYLLLHTTFLFSKFGLSSAIESSMSRFAQLFTIDLMLQGGRMTGCLHI